MSEETKRSEEESEARPPETAAAAEELEGRVLRLERERDEYLDGWKRAKADLVNYRREEEARLREVARFGTSELVRELIAVLVSFDLGRAAIADATTPLARGMLLIQSQLEDVLKRYGLERLTTAPGEPFDPALHEAVGETASELPEQTVVREVERGYRMNGKVLRPARILLSKGRGAREEGVGGGERVGEGE